MKENKTLTERWSYWDLEHGFLNALQPPPIPSPDHRRRRRAAAATDALEDRAPLGDELPLRALSPGRSMGLSVMLNVKEDEYYCSGTESVGLKSLLHMPMTMPELLEYGFGVHPGTETFVSVKPEMIDAEEEIQSFDYHKRQCYLNSDRELFFFKNYTFLNCFQECAANYTNEVGLQIPL